MNKEIVSKIFPEMIKKMGSGYCPFCEKIIIEDSFKDELSLKEYKISGLCQNCQDKMFK